MSEQFAVLPDVAFVSALMDAMMTAPNSATLPLFDPAIFDIHVGGDASVAGSNRVITVPFTKVIITIGLPYGNETIYLDGQGGIDQDLRVSFTVWSNTGADQKDAEQRLVFARDKRVAAFANHGLILQTGPVNARRRPYQPIEGIVATDYRWRFFYARP